MHSKNPAYVPDAATIHAMSPQHTAEAYHAPAPTLPLHDSSDWRRETAILAEVDSGYPWND